MPTYNRKVVVIREFTELLGNHLMEWHGWSADAVRSYGGRTPEMVAYHERLHEDETAHYLNHTHPKTKVTSPSTDTTSGESGAQQMLRTVLNLLGEIENDWRGIDSGKRNADLVLGIIDRVHDRFPELLTDMSAPTADERRDRRVAWSLLIPQGTQQIAVMRSACPTPEHGDPAHHPHMIDRGSGTFLCPGIPETSTTAFSESESPLQRWTIELQVGFDTNDWSWGIVDEVSTPVREMAHGTSPDAKEARRRIAHYFMSIWDRWDQR